MVIMSIQLKSAADLEKMRVAGRLAAEVLQVVAPHVKPGVTTAELDRICHDHRTPFRPTSATVASPPRCVPRSTT